MMAEILKDRFSISEDELNHRMELQQKYHDEPLQKAVQILEAALDKVLTGLGVNVELGDIQAQQEQLGIIITEETRPEMSGINGFYIFLSRKGDIIPHSWVGAARLNNNGECFCDVHYFQDERLVETGGIKLIG